MSYTGYYTGLKAQKLKEQLAQVQEQYTQVMDSFINDVLKNHPDWSDDLDTDAILPEDAHVFMEAGFLVRKYAAETAPEHKKARRAIDSFLGKYAKKVAKPIVLDE